MGHVVNLIFWPPKPWMNLDLQAPSPKSSVWLHRGERRLGRCLHKCDVWNLVFLQTPLKVEGYSCLLMPTDGGILKHMCCSWWEMSGRSPWKALFQFDVAGTSEMIFLPICILITFNAESSKAKSWSARPPTKTNGVVKTWWLLPWCESQNYQDPEGHLGEFSWAHCW